MPAIQFAHLIRHVVFELPRRHSSRPAAAGCGARAWTCGQASTGRSEGCRGHGSKWHSGYELVAAYASVAGDVTRGVPGGNMGDDEPRTWLTYAEAGRALEMQPGSAKRLSFRRHWPRRMGNDGLARVGVPVAALRYVSDDTDKDATGVATGDSTGDATRGNTGDTLRDNTGDSTETDGDASPAAFLKTLTAELAHARTQLAVREGELAGLREALRVMEAETREAARRADRAEQAALDAWHATADLVRLLTPSKVVNIPAKAVRPQRGWLRRLLG